MEPALSRLSGLRLGALLLPFLIGCGGTDADLTSTPAVAASPKAAVQETPSPTPPPATVEPSASPGPIVPPIAEFTMQASPLPTGSRPHDVAPALDGGSVTRRRAPESLVDLTRLPGTRYHATGHRLATPWPHSGSGRRPVDYRRRIERDRAG